MEKKAFLPKFKESSMTRKVTRREFNIECAKLLITPTALGFASCKPQTQSLNTLSDSKAFSNIQESQIYNYIQANFSRIVSELLSFLPIKFKFKTPNFSVIKAELEQNIKMTKSFMTREKIPTVQEILGFLGVDNESNKFFVIGDLNRFISKHENEIKKLFLTITENETSKNSLSLKNERGPGFFNNVQNLLDKLWNDVGTSWNAMKFSLIVVLACGCILVAFPTMSAVAVASTFIVGVLAIISTLTFFVRSRKNVEQIMLPPETEVYRCPRFKNCQN